MVKARVQGSKRTIWIDSRQAEQPTDDHHPPLRGRARQLLAIIKAVLDEVNPQWMDKWENDSRKDAHPDREVSLWLLVAVVIRRATAGATAGNERNVAQKGECFRVILACANTRRDNVLFLVQRDELPQQAAEKVIDLLCREVG